MIFGVTGDINYFSWLELYGHVQTVLDLFSSSCMKVLAIQNFKFSS